LLAALLQADDAVFRHGLRAATVSFIQKPSRYPVLLPAR
jgi:hypothetical protein